MKRCIVLPDWCMLECMIDIGGPNPISPKEVDCDCLPTGMCVSPITGMGLHMRVGVKEHDIFCGPKSYKFKLLGNLVVQQCSLYNINDETVNNLLLSYNIKSYGPLQ